MGVRGLTEYMNNKSDLYYEPYELRDTFLVIDGYSLLFYLFYNMEEDNSIFGGDYDAFHKTVQNFFSTLAKCNVIPIVLIDGGIEQRKMKTVLSRRQEAVDVLQLLWSEKYMCKLNCLLLTRVFVAVASEANVTLLHCYLEADNEIASVAAALNCPVLSTDSDFYFYDVLYIPLASVELEPVRVKLSNKKSLYHLKCSIFKMNNFLEVNELEKPLIPILISFMGNDYNNGCVFNQFFDHITLPQSRKSYTQRKIHGAIQWLKKENYESAIKGILLHVRKKDWDKVLGIIKLNENAYSHGTLSQSACAKINKLLGSGSIQVKVKNPIVNWPQEIDNLFVEGKLSDMIMNMINFSVCLTSVVIEDTSLESVHTHFFYLIQAIFKVICHYVPGKKSNLLKVYCRHYKKYGYVTLDSNDDLENLDLSGLLEKSQAERLSLLFRILQLEGSDVKIISTFDDSWMLIIASFIYWCKECSSILNSFHLHAVLLMMVVNKVVQSCVGYHKSNFTFISKYKKLLREVENEEIKLANSANNYEALLDSVTLPECVLVQKELMPLRTVNKTLQKMLGTPKAIGKLGHKFNSFQSCLFYIGQLNVLLKHPLPEMKIPDFYSGTLLFNFYLGIENQGVDHFAGEILSRGPNVLRIYQFLCQNLSQYVRIARNVRESPKKVKKYRVLEQGANFDDSNKKHDCLLQRIQALCTE